LETAPPFSKLPVMPKKIISLILLAAVLAGAEEPAMDAAEVLAFARSRLPVEPVVLRGTLRERSANGHVRRKLDIEMNLFWGESPSRAEYRVIQRTQKQTLKITWRETGPEYRFFRDGEEIESLDVNSEIAGSGVTWADLSFSFLWSRDAVITGKARKLGRESWAVRIPRGAAGTRRLWIEQHTGLVLGVEGHDADGLVQKIIKIVSIKKQDGLWLAKDIDIIRPGVPGRVSLRVEVVETGE